jgi:Leucine-rich repeat (LRR) protein
VLDLSGAASLRSLGSSFSSLIRLTELNLSGPSGLWADYSAAAAATTAAAAAANTHSSSVEPGLAEHLNLVGAAGCCTSSAAAARAALPQLLLPPLPHQQQVLLLPELAALQQLRRLVLAHNRQLVVLPGALSVLTGLSHLDASGCGLRWLGDEVLSCSGLQELLLSDNVLVELPDDISRLQPLRVSQLVDVAVLGCGWGDNQWQRVLVSLCKVASQVQGVPSWHVVAAAGSIPGCM